MSDQKAGAKPATETYVIDRCVYNGGGVPPLKIGSKHPFAPADVAHLVAAGFMHKDGMAAAPVAAMPSPGGTVEAPPPNSPLMRAAPATAQNT